MTLPVGVIVRGPEVSVGDVNIRPRGHEHLHGLHMASVGRQVAGRVTLRRLRVDVSSVRYQQSGEGKQQAKGVNCVPLTSHE